MANCLFVVDVQNGFINKETIHVVERIQNLLEKDLFDHVIFTKFLNTEESPFTEFLNWRGLISEDEREIHPKIKKFAKTVFSKHTYSAINQETLHFINEHNITEAYIVGVDTDCCVLTTATNLFENHIRPFILEYYCASGGGMVSHQAGIKALERLIGEEHIIPHNIEELHLDNKPKNR